jgi:hypothetical protein
MSSWTTKTSANWRSYCIDQIGRRCRIHEVHHDAQLVARQRTLPSST